MRKKFLFIFFLLIFLIISIQVLFQIVKNLTINIETGSDSDVSQFNDKKKYLVECKLFNEIIDRKKN